MSTSWPSSGACLYAGNNCRAKGWAYKVNNQRIGYARVDNNGDPIGQLVAPQRWRYTIRPLTESAANPEFQVIGLPKAQIRSTLTQTYALNNPAMPMPGREMVYEDRRDAAGNVVLRPDSTSVFQPTGVGLWQRYRSLYRAFTNVHDDQADGGTSADSLSNFMDMMRGLPNNLDFFAYAGHGYTAGLSSAGLARGTSAYTEFIEILRRIVRPDGAIIFYACSTGAASGFAQTVSGDIPGVTVFGHEIPGHGQTNPFKVRVRAGVRETFQTLLGDDFARWRSYIKKKECDIWRRYPWMSIESIKAEVQAGKQLEICLLDI